MYANLGFLKEMSKCSEYFTTKIPSNYILSTFDFCYVPATGQYTRGERKKTQIKGRTEKRKTRKVRKIQGK